MTMRQEIKRYIIGFLLCLLLTVTAYLLATTIIEPTGQLDMFILISLTILALLQFIVQSIYFLHVENSPSGKWHFVAFWSMLSVVLIIVIGSIWIMWNLNYNMHHVPTGEEAEQFIIEDEGFGDSLPNHQH